MGYSPWDRKESDTTERLSRPTCTHVVMLQGPLQILGRQCHRNKYHFYKILEQAKLCTKRDCLCTREKAEPSGSSLHRRDTWRVCVPIIDNLLKSSDFFDQQQVAPWWLSGIGSTPVRGKKCTRISYKKAQNKVKIYS